MQEDEIKSLLDQKHDAFNRPSFIESDPISIPHQFSKKEDIEISGFLVSIIAWGRRDIIIRNGQNLVERMDMAPYDFVRDAGPKDFQKLESFVHRTFNAADAISLLRALQRAYRDFGGLESLFAQKIKRTDSDVFHGIMHVRNILTSTPDFPSRSHKHLANPSRGSAAKRINMFLRWMVRSDKRGVDFGIWKSISTAQLICPLDVHTATVGRKLGLIRRKQNDWKSAVELTENLKKYCPDDPVKYDFSLFGMGVYEGF